MLRITIAVLTALFFTASAQAEIIAHPVGCPKRAFCGCGASVEIFGKPVRELFLARNWFRFPRAEPGPGMVAVRRGHVFVLRSHVQGQNWIVYDANSGRRKTRVHHRSIAGWTIVNPHASKLAQAEGTFHSPAF
mgnify:CR=1 FL=1